MKRWSAISMMVGLGAASLWVVYAFIASERVTAPRLPALSHAQLEYLSEGLEARADAMQRLFPEGRVFMLALYGGAWVNLGRGAYRTSERERARLECGRALQLLESPESQRPFSEAGGLPHGMFYEAWTNWLRGGCLLLEPDGGLRARSSAPFVAACARIEHALAESGPFVESYRGAAWPADSVVGAASLGLCAELVDARYRASLSSWLRAVRARLDPVTGLVPHAANRPGARGSSSALMAAFWPDIDRDFAQAQYQKLREQFPGALFGVLAAAREYPRGTEGAADVDSGPIISGVSGPATIVMIAAARSNGDVETALSLRRASEALGLPFEWAGRRRYGFGLLPIGEAFLAWSSVAEPWTTQLEPRAPPSAFPSFEWRLRALAALLVSGFGGLTYMLARELRVPRANRRTEPVSSPAKPRS